MPHRGTNYFHLHLVSDATGETLITVARAAAAQYANVSPVEHMHPLVRSHKQLDRVLAEIENAPGIVLYTLLEKELATRLEEACRNLGVPYLSILGPVLQLFQAYLGGETKPRIGAQHTLNAEYFKRIDALNYTMLHDDGQHVDDLEQADVVLVGVSRTSKTPLSIYLGYLGHKVANVPIVKGIDPPKELFEINPVKIVGLTIHADRLADIRRARARNLGGNNRRYAELGEVYDELEEASAIHRRLGCPVIDISDLSIEETAQRILRTVESRKSEAAAAKVS